MPGDCSVHGTRLELDLNIYIFIYKTAGYRKISSGVAGPQQHLHQYTDWSELIARHNH